ncbi:NFACT family protein [Candidatus Woesearchaeota archaeon]|nr:NFACT family protein [Candidatus Woesearchaeota archaeon]
MKHLSAFELGFVVSELQHLVGARLDQIYQPGDRELLLQFHVPSKGRAILKVRVPYAIYLCSGKEPASGEVSHFCDFLRKRLKNSVLAAISQLGFERVVQLDFGSKTGRFSLFFELFSKGNVILVKDGVTLAAVEYQSWSTRAIRQGKPYSLPPAAADPASFDVKLLSQLLKSTNKSDVVRFLAIELSFGGLYAEELCLLSKIGREAAPSSLAAAEVSVLLQSVKELLASKPSPSLIYDGSSIVDAVPVALRFYSQKRSEPSSAFSLALERLYSVTAAAPSAFDAAISGLQFIIARQEDAIKSAKQLVVDCTRRGELIYEHYQEVKGILDAVNSARKSGGWVAVRQVMKSNKRIKSLDEKKGVVVVEL